MGDFLKCRDCGHIFSESDAGETRTTYESMYGVSHLFSYSTPCSYSTCPHCGSDDLDDVEGDTLCEDCGALDYEENMYSIILGMTKRYRSFYKDGRSSYEYIDTFIEPSFCFDCWLKRVSASEDAMNFWINYFSTYFSEEWPEYIEAYNSVKDKSIIDILTHLHSINPDIIGGNLWFFFKFQRDLWLERKDK
jgi:hypothetical protein